MLGDRLRDHGIPCAILIGHHPVLPPSPDAAGRWPHIPAAFIRHWALSACGHVIDLTARQIAPSAAHPLIVTVGEFARDYHQVTVWACDTCPALVTDPAHALLAPTGMHQQHATLARDGHIRFPDPRHPDPVPHSICRCANPAAVRDTTEPALA